MYKHRKNQEGMALIMAFMAIMLILAAVTVVMQKVHYADKGTTATINTIAIDEACKAGIELAVSNLWLEYIESNGNTTGNLASYRYFLENTLQIPNNEDLNQNGEQDAGEHDVNGDGVFEIATPQIVKDIANEADDLLVGESDARVAGLTLFRTDDATGTVFTIHSTGQVDDRQQTVVQTVRVSGAPFSGYEYAVLAKNINCILCHAEFKAIDQQYNVDADMYGDFDRIKVATLESLLYRKTSADSSVAGTVYTRGDVYNTNGSAMSAADIAGSDFKGYDFDRTNGKLLEDGSGSMSQVSFTNATVDGEGHPEQFATLYQNYPEDSALQTDGTLPSSFPAPYPDDNEDRYVDNDEFDTIADTLIGSIDGGVAYGVPTGDFYADSGLPGASNGAMASLSNSGTYDGNVILVGTDDNPILLDGDIAIDGDLMIAGKIKGRGQLFVRGNTYMVGDVTYADASGDNLDFGRASDGTENALALITGGSVLVGDYVTIRGKSHTEDLSKYPDKSASIHSRQAHISRDKTKNDTTQTLDYGYFDPGAVDAGGIIETMLDDEGNEVPRQGQQFSFTTSELMLFNNMELEKAVADSSYTPRFYGLRDSQPDNIYVYHNGTQEHAVHYTEKGGGVQTLTDYMIDEGISLDILDRAAVHYMNPTDNWITEDALRQIWWDDEMQRDRGDIFKFDGLMYSNNAIFAITRSYSRHKSNSDGKMEIRGAVICPDLGVLTPGGFCLLYDRRVKQFWAPEDTSQVAFQRLIYVPVAHNEEST